MLQQIVHKIQDKALKSTLKTFKLCKSSVAAESGSRPGPIILFTLLLAARLHFRWSHLIVIIVYISESEKTQET